MRGATLHRAILDDTSLFKVDLRGADLSQTNLSDVDLASAYFCNTTLWPPGFDPVDAGAINLDDANDEHGTMNDE
jgi:uncharacterized protein YjbI with pentapeptide repeats